MNDSTAQTTYIDVRRDKYVAVIKEIDNWRVSRRKGQISLYFDGGGAVVRFTMTTEGK
jgi:hypothetical protein